MRIQIYLDNEDQTNVSTFFNMTSNPFSLGDIIPLSVGQLAPSKMEEYNERSSDKLHRDNEKLKETFRFKSVKLTKEKKYITINTLDPDELVIEYFCEFVDENN